MPKLVNEFAKLPKLYTVKIALPPDCESDEQVQMPIHSDNLSDLPFAPIADTEEEYNFCVKGKADLLFKNLTRPDTATSSVSIIMKDYLNEDGLN